MNLAPLMVAGQANERMGAPSAEQPSSRSLSRLSGSLKGSKSNSSQGRFETDRAERERERVIKISFAKRLSSDHLKKTVLI